MEYEEKKTQRNNNNSNNTFAKLLIKSGEFYKQ